MVVAGSRQTDVSLCLVCLKFPFPRPFYSTFPPRIKLDGRKIEKKGMVSVVSNDEALLIDTDPSNLEQTPTRHPTWALGLLMAHGFAGLGLH